MPAFYLPIIFMLLGLIFRGVAFEFRFKAAGWARKAWDYAFHFGSLTAAFMQGAVLGTFIQGIAVKERQFAGGVLDWVSPFALMTGTAVVFGYALLGATWVIMKTDEETQEWARKCAEYVCVFVAVFMVLVSVSTPLLNDRFKILWFSRPNLYFLAPLPVLTLGMFLLLWRSLVQKSEYRPFFLSIGIFLAHYLGLGVSLWPWIVPFRFTLWDAAAAPPSQSLLLVGTLFLLPLVLGYTAYSFYTFRGKASHEGYY
jgi:cytochrome d ubiquinol oxidase subunit II